MYSIWSMLQPYHLMLQDGTERLIRESLACACRAYGRDWRTTLCTGTGCGMTGASTALSSASSSKPLWPSFSHCVITE